MQVPISDFIDLIIEDLRFRKLDWTSISIGKTTQIFAEVLKGQKEIPTVQISVKEDLENGWRKTWAKQNAELYRKDEIDKAIRICYKQAIMQKQIQGTTAETITAAEAAITA